MKVGPGGFEKGNENRVPYLDLLEDVYFSLSFFVFFGEYVFLGLWKAIQALQ